MHDPAEFDLDTEHAAQLLGVQSKELSRKRYAVLQRLVRGRRCFYRRADIDAFLIAQVRAPALAKLAARRGDAITIAATK
jgi:hypothetical protein